MDSEHDLVFIVEDDPNPGFVFSDSPKCLGTETVVSNPDRSKKTVFISHSFPRSDADITIISCDDVRFHISKKNLASNTGGFPPVELTSTSSTHEEVTLSERGFILDLLFQFVYPQRYPDLKYFSAGVILELADAAEKYEVYGAISMCNVVLKFTAPTHPVEVFAYATRFDYLDIADDAAPFVLGTPLSHLADKLTSDALTSWIRYIESCNSVRRSWIITIIQAMNRSRIGTASYSNGGGHVADCSQQCRHLQTMLTEVSMSMISMKRVTELVEAVSCTYCKPYVISLATQAPGQFSGIPKFRTFWVRRA